MPLSFDALPWFTQKSIAEKMNYADFAGFQQASQTAVSTAERVKSPFFLDEKLCSVIYFEVRNKEACCTIATETVRGWNTFKLKETPRIRFEGSSASIWSPANEEFCQDLIGLFGYSGSTVSRLHFRKTVDAAEKAFVELLRIAEVKDLCITTGSISPEAFRSVPESITRIECSAPLEDSDLMSSRIQDMKIAGTRITSEGINRFLKEWRDGKRRIAFIEFWTSERPLMYEFLEDFEYEAISTDLAYRETTLENGLERLEVSLWIHRGESCVCFRVKEDSETVEEPMEWEEVVGGDCEEDEDW